MQLAILFTVCGIVSHEFMSLCCSHQFIIHLPWLKYLWAVRSVSSQAPVVLIHNSNVGICHSRHIWGIWLLFHHQWPKRLLDDLIMKRCWPVAHLHRSGNGIIFSITLFTYDASDQLTMPVSAVMHVGSPSNNPLLSISNCWPWPSSKRVSWK